MTSLTISCALTCDSQMKRPPGPLTLTRVIAFEGESVEEPWNVTKVEPILTGGLSFVFRAKILPPNKELRHVVLKVDPTGEREKAFLKELEAYQTSGSELQGWILPRFHGCFQVDIGQTTVTCLAMEYRGEPMQRALDWTQLDDNFLSELLSNVAEMHKRGMTHGDLYERNILVNGASENEDDHLLHGHPVLIDLEFTESHTCHRRMELVPGAIMPTVEEYGCAELHNLILRLGLWKSDTLHFCATYIKKKRIDSVEDLTWAIPEEYGHDSERRRRLEAKANLLYNELCDERLLTYGAKRLSERG
ncbi:hypothetical protein C8R43DRAFT_1136312 [Mycena crocata]|nr:hypothetical protein C8R43DRAFT_1136312 [Mycena crocata]